MHFPWCHDWGNFFIFFITFSIYLPHSLLFEMCTYMKWYNTSRFLSHKFVCRDASLSPVVSLILNIYKHHRAHAPGNEERRSWFGLMCLWASYLSIVDRILTVQNNLEEHILSIIKSCHFVQAKIIIRLWSYDHLVLKVLMLVI